MAWVTWRQHRIQLLAGAGILFAVALLAIATGPGIRDAYDQQGLAACLPPGSRSGCEIIVRHFQSEHDIVVLVARYLVFLPALIAVFVGAPLLARELEHGTYRLAWTQGVTRKRWLLSQTLLLALATVLGALALSAIVMWWRLPFDRLDGRMSPSRFEVEGIVVPAYAVFALALGVFSGALLRRTVPAMTAALAAFVAIRLAVANFLRPRYLAPEHATATGLTPNTHAHDWVLSNSLVDAVGRQISAARENLAIVHAQNAGIDAQEYLLSLGWRRAVTFQPADRFWTFQLIEAAIFVGLAAAIVLVTLRLLERAPA
jgi:ABC-type transport system involved in multi-copper enzyme maturation permease subunit